MTRRGSVGLNEWYLRIIDGFLKKYPRRWKDRSAFVLEAVREKFKSLDDEEKYGEAREYRISHSSHSTSERKEPPAP